MRNGVPIARLPSVSWHIVLAIPADSKVFAGEETLGKSRISALIWLTSAAKFLSLANPLAISVSGDSRSVEIQARSMFRSDWPDGRGGSYGYASTETGPKSRKSSRNVRSLGMT